MSIISISKTSYSRGGEVAKMVAEKLNYSCVSRDILVETSKDFNIPEVKLARAMHDAPTVLERFTHGKERYISYFQSTFLNHVVNDKLVYHGLAGHFFLQDISHALKVRIISNIESRIQEEMKHEDCSDEVALYNLRKNDEERRRWSMQIYGKDTWDSSLYDIVLHLDNLTVTDAVDIIVATAQKEQFQPTPVSMKKLRNRALLANIYTQLVDHSPHATVKMTEDSTVIIGNLDGSLKNDSAVRGKIAMKLKEKFEINDVVFEKPVKPEQEYVNTFYNLDLS